MRPLMKVFLATALFLLGQACLPGELKAADHTPELRIKTFDGRDFDLRQFRNRVVLVSFWATWCTPCLLEMPVLERFYKTYHDQGVEIIALSVDFPKDREKAKKLMAKLSFPGAFLKEAARNGFGTPDAVPILYLVDGRGVVRDTFLEVDEALLKGTVLPLLREAQPQAIVFHPND